MTAADLLETIVAATRHAVERAATRRARWQLVTRRMQRRAER